MSAVGYVVKQMTVKIDTKDYACAVTSVREVPNTPIQETQTACADGTKTDKGKTTWTIDVTANVDLAADSLYRLLTDPANDGKAASLEYAPDALNHPDVVKTANVTLVPVGGDFTVNSWATFTVSLPVTGAPTYKPAAPVVP